MSDEKKPEQPTVKDVLKKQKEDVSWKCEPWVGPDGYQYRKNRVRLKNGTYKVITVKVGSVPIVEPEK